jgi:hypothetical protein
MNASPKSGVHPVYRESIAAPLPGESKGSVWYPRVVLAATWLSCFVFDLVPMMVRGNQARVEAYDNGYERDQNNPHQLNDPSSGVLALLPLLWFHKKGH